MVQQYIQEPSEMIARLFGPVPMERTISMEGWVLTRAAGRSTGTGDFYTSTDMSSGLC